MLARTSLPQRSRDDARALAAALHQQARAQPELFRQLVEQHSEHRDAVLGGDFGSWSTGAEALPAANAPARAARLGEVGTPVETHLGFEIIQRTEDHAREWYAARAARLPIDPEAPASAGNWRSRVLVEAVSWRARMQPTRGALALTAS